MLLEPRAARIAARYLTADLRCGGVSLNLQVRNIWASLITRFQAIEYLISITFGKHFTDVVGLMSNVSGAAGVFRRSALIDVGGLDIEVAEDAALTGKLRAAGWTIRFAPDAIAETLVPEGIIGLLMQRLRWDFCGGGNLAAEVRSPPQPVRARLQPSAALHVAGRCLVLDRATDPIPDLCGMALVSRRDCGNSSPSVFGDGMPRRHGNLNHPLDYTTIQTVALRSVLSGCAIVHHAAGADRVHGL